MSINVAAIPSPFIHATIKRRKNTWYTIASGNWSDPNIWMSNSHRRYNYPQAGDDVSIGLGHTVTFNTAANSTTVVNNLYVAGTLNTLGQSGFRTLSVLGDLQATGAINLTQTVNNPTLNLSGVNNFISSFTAGISTVAYVRENGDQPIMDLSYFNLTLDRGGTKYLTNNISIAGGLNVSLGIVATATVFESSNFNVTVNGTTTITAGGYFSKTGAGNLLFIGLFTFPNNSTIQGLSLTGNPAVEFRGGFTFSTIGTFLTGTNTWSLTTNAQTATVNTANLQFNCPISVVGAIAVSEAGTGIMSLNQPIDCTSASGSVVAKGTIYFNSTSSLPSFTQGTFDRTSFANTVGYTMGASITLPYTSYSSLYVSNTGVKTLAGNTTLSGGLTVNNGITAAGTLEAAGFDLSVGGATALGIGTLSKNSTGNVLFTGLVSVGGNPSALNFSGNPTVECRGGLFSNTTNGFSFSSGTGQWTFSTNNQSIAMASGGGSVTTFNFDAPLLISGAITLTLSSPSGGQLTLGLRQPINGNNAGSTLTNGARIEFLTAASVNSMTTGILNLNGTTTNTTAYTGYLFDGDYTIPLTSYNGLAIGGTGTKTLSGNTTLTYGYVQPSGTFEMLNFNLSVGGTTTITGSGTFSKNGAGNILFVGAVSYPVTTVLSLSGNPSVEFRAGLGIVSIIVAGFNTGTGTWSFTTNNQSITGVSGQSLTFACSLLISGAITLTASGTQAWIFTNTINGNNAASTLDNRITGSLQYQATQQPMLTGVLQTNLAANTFIYNGNISQNITGGTYRTMQIGGTATPNNKTLQGNIVVATAYSATGNAVLVLNSFTKT